MAMVKQQCKKRDIIVVRNQDEKRKRYIQTYQMEPAEEAAVTVAWVLKRTPQLIFHVLCRSGPAFFFFRFFFPPWFQVTVQWGAVPRSYSKTSTGQ